MSIIVKAYVKTGTRTVILSYFKKHIVNNNKNTMRVYVCICLYYIHIQITS